MWLRSVFGLLPCEACSRCTRRPGCTPRPSTEEGVRCAAAGVDGTEVVDAIAGFGGAGLTGAAVFRVHGAFQSLPGTNTSAFGFSHEWLLFATGAIAAPLLPERGSGVTGDPVGGCVRAVDVSYSALPVPCTLDGSSVFPDEPLDREACNDVDTGFPAGAGAEYSAGASTGLCVGLGTDDSAGAAAEDGVGAGAGTGADVVLGAGAEAGADLDFRADKGTGADVETGAGADARADDVVGAGAEPRPVAVF